MSSLSTASVLESLFAPVWQTSLRASVLIGLVLGLFFLFRRLGPSWKILFATLVFVRLLVPVSPESRFSVFNLWKEKTSFSNQKGAFSETTLFIREGISNVQGKFDEPTLLLRKTPVSETPRFHVSWLKIASAVWLGGVFLILGIAIIRQARLNRGLKFSDNFWQDEQLRCFEELGIQRRQVLPVCFSNLMCGPAIAGLFRPRLILPVNFGTTFSASERYAILLHELAHLKRGDLIWSGLTFLVAALHWMNPLVWMVRRGFVRDLELACDGTVLRKMNPTERPIYGRVLLRVAESIAVPKEQMAVLSAPFFNDNSNLKDRIQMIVNPKKTTKCGALAMVGAVMAICLGTFTSATADDKPDEKTQRGTETSETRRLLATAERLEKLGLGKEAAEYRAKAGGDVVAEPRAEGRDGDRDRVEMQRRDGERARPVVRRDEDRPVREQPVRQNVRKPDGSTDRGELAERLRRLEAENRELRAELERLQKGRD